MQSVNCANCGERFDFESSKIWTSPGQIKKTRHEKPQRLVVPCPKCQTWTTVELKDDSIVQTSRS